MVNHKNRNTHKLILKDKMAQIFILLTLLLCLAQPVSSPVLEQTAQASNLPNIVMQTADVTPQLFLPVIKKTYGSTLPRSSSGWPTVAANPQRSSWNVDEVSGNLHVEWYRPIEAYISQNTQIIAANGLLYISTAKGLYALNAENGATVWQFDTELPMGNSPTVADGVVYVAGHDRNLYALDALSGILLWAFSQAGAGYDTNPLVVEGKVILGNRDGSMYAIGAHKTNQAGQLIWKYSTGAPIHFSAAYNNGVIYFASNDQHAYALQAENGNLVWRSETLIGDGFHSYWPVIYQDKVIFATSSPYRHYVDPGTLNVIDANGEPYDDLHKIERDDVFFDKGTGQAFGNLLPPQDWAGPNRVIDGSRLTQYLEDNPNPSAHLHKPWRRSFVMLNASSGSEYRFDSDQDGYPEYIPFVRAGSNSGNRYPGIIGPDGLFYGANIYLNLFIPQAKVMGWLPGSNALSLTQLQHAIDEPTAISGGGNIIYQNLCCDRVGSWSSIVDPRKNGILWDYTYTLDVLAPGYDDMWTVLPGLPRLSGWYKGNTDSVNGIYHNHGDQNPIIPYNGRLYVHRSNAIIAFGSGAELGKQPLLRINPINSSLKPLPTSQIRARLETEIQKILDAGLLRPGYYNTGQFNIYSELGDYFDNPGDTLLTLSLAYPHLSPDLQSDVLNYLDNYFRTYFNPTLFATTGWVGASRQDIILPPEVEVALPGKPAQQNNGPRFSWAYPPQNFYAMWKYASIVPQSARTIYELAKSRLVVPIPSYIPVDNFRQKPYELNAYIAGYYGFIGLYNLAGIQDNSLLNQVQSELNRLQQMRVDIFSKDTYWVEDNYHKRHLNIARNFMMLVPELGQYLANTIAGSIQDAVDEYATVAPYWFVTRYEATIDEGAMSNLYNNPAMFMANAYILNKTQEELYPYLDAPAFQIGDLFYIRNLIILLEARSASQ